MPRQRVEFNQWRSDPLGIEPRLRFGAIAGGNRAEPKPGNSRAQPARHDTADGAEACDCDRN